MPKSSAAASTASTLAPSASNCMAADKCGTSSRLTTKPGTSATTNGRWPMASAKSTAAATVSGCVLSLRTISSIGPCPIGRKKWQPHSRPGSRSGAERRASGMVEVFVARIDTVGQQRLQLRQQLLFDEVFSATDSTTTVAPAASSKSLPSRTRRSTSALALVARRGRCVQPGGNPLASRGEGLRAFIDQHHRDLVPHRGGGDRRTHHSGTDDPDRPAADGGRPPRTASGPAVVPRPSIAGHAGPPLRHGSRLRGCEEIWFHGHLEFPVGGSQAVEFRNQFRHRFIDIGHQAVVGRRKNRRLRVAIDGHDESWSSSCPPGAGPSRKGPRRCTDPAR